MLQMWSQTPCPAFDSATFSKPSRSLSVDCYLSRGCSLGITAEDGGRMRSAKLFQNKLIFVTCAGAKLRPRRQARMLSYKKHKQKNKHNPSAGSSVDQFTWSLLFCTAEKPRRCWFHYSHHKSGFVFVIGEDIHCTQIPVGRVTYLREMYTRDV